jgi:beta-fructofuranosidase
MANQSITPPPDGGSYSRPSPAQAAADAIPLLVDDTYHLFHLTTPPFTRHHPQRLRSSWWRMRSKDGVSWTRDPEPSIHPGAPSSPDADGAWTGAAVIGPEGNMHVFYTGYNLSQNGRQVILHTQSPDQDGTSFPSSPGKEITVLGEGRSQLEDIDFRDPFIFFHEKEGRYWMLIASRLASGPHWSRGCIALLTSPDLETWTFESEPLYAPNDMFCPECPELWSLPNGKWYLVYSRFHAPNAGTVYRVADSPYGPFRIPRDGSAGRLDGRRWYAAKSCAKAGDPSKRVAFGWTGDYVDEEGKWLWGGDLGIPRQLSAGEDGYLRVDPLPEALDLFGDTSRAVETVPTEIQLSATGQTKTSFMALGAAESQDVLVTFSIGQCDAHSFGLVLQADGSEKGHRLQIIPCGQGTYSVLLLTDFPPLDDFWADQYDLHLPRPVDGPEIVRHDGVKLAGGVTMLLRGQLVEVFCGGRSISFRLPVPLAVTDNEMNELGKVQRHRLGWFVEDGEVNLNKVSVRYGGLACQMSK